ncbi:Spy/CpxP family protein refolding chaperone [Marinobacterium aestuariivivens]|uniref:Spy/CpxP family protein refolding chaperone n=1 Tax=Marinobacterium aestuariivivens TaxID=1698799 RepID=A0ABW1ZYW3_9GAMM
MRKPLIIAMTALTLSAGAIGLAQAHDKGEGGRYSPEKRLERMTEQLQLTDEQRGQMQTLMEQQREQRPEKGQGREIHRQLRDLDPAAEDYQQRLDDLVGQAQQQLGERMRARAAHRAAMAEILTDEQEQKLADWQKDRWGKGHHGDRGHGGKHRRGDCDDE